VVENAGAGQVNAEPDKKNHTSVQWAADTINMLDVLVHYVEES
jgi:hypothetical protein